jgi:hypothetical protein
MITIERKYLSCFELINMHVLVNSGYLLERERERERETGPYVINVDARAQDSENKSFKQHNLFVVFVGLSDGKFFLIRKNMSKQTLPRIISYLTKITKIIIITFPILCVAWFCAFAFLPDCFVPRKDDARRRPVFAGSKAMKQSGENSQTHAAHGIYSFIFSLFYPFMGLLIAKMTASTPHRYEIRSDEAIRRKYANPCRAQYSMRVHYCLPDNPAMPDPDNHS